MNNWQPVLQLARRNLIALVLVALLSAGLWFGISYLASQSSVDVAQLRNALQEQSRQLRAKEVDLRDQRNNRRRFEELRAAGLVGNPDRARWVEQFEASLRAIGLTQRPIYTLQTAKPLALDANLPVPVDPAAVEVLAHDLQFELHQVHTDDVLRLIDDYRTRAAGHFRVNACNLHDPKADGLLAQCVLRFVSVRLSPNANANAAVLAN